jgi:hypothetical protein
MSDSNRDIRVVLTREEMSTAAQGASMRWQLARAAGVGNQKHDDSRDDSAIDLLGIKAEMAVANAYQLTHSPFMCGVDTGSDMFSGSIGLDVKAAFTRDGNLLFKKLSSFKADVGVLAVLGEEEDVIIIRGWVTQTRFYKDAKTIKVGDTGRAMVLSHTKLSAPETLWRYLTQLRTGVAA